MPTSNASFALIRSSPPPATTPRNEVPAFFLLPLWRRRHFPENWGRRGSPARGEKDEGKSEFSSRVLCPRLLFS